jgi:DNA-binding beta-propeller fold protein YncE
VKVSPCAQWNKKGITIAGITKQPGNSSSQLNGPRGIFIRKSANTLYVADTENNRIQMFALNQSSMMGLTVASTETSPYRIYIDEDHKPTMYISLRDSHRVEKWIDGALSGVKVGNECYSCEGIAVDKEKNVYMVESLKSRVIKWSPETNITTIVAGNADLNSSLDERLFSPLGIYIDKNDGSLYIADCFYDRIQKWPKGGAKGTTVAGASSYTPGVVTELLSCPSAVLVDEEINMMYIVDAVNKRIQRWLINALEGETIAGRSGMFNYLFVWI